MLINLEDMAKQVSELEITELRLGLPGGGGGPSFIDKKEKKRMFSEMAGDGNSTDTCSGGDRKGQRKNEVVGWPPVCSYRKKNSFNEKDATNSKMYLKVSMDGAPFLRKIDMSMHTAYPDLALALSNLFGCFGIGESYLIFSILLLLVLRFN